MGEETLEPSTVIGSVRQHWYPELQGIPRSSSLTPKATHIAMKHRTATDFIVSFATQRVKN